MLKKYSYFVSYIIETKVGISYNNAVIQTPKKIKLIEDIEKIEKRLMDGTDYKKLKIQNLILL